MRYRQPRSHDGGLLWSLARGSGGLDENSSYAYLLFTHHFTDTCIVAESEDGPAGFVLGFRPPASPGTLFVWQIAVAPAYRGRGAGVEMLAALLERLGDDIRYLEATVTPSNEASSRMFRALAKRLDAPYHEEAEPLFPAAAFPEGGHEEERAIRIGPFESITAKRRQASRAIA